MSESNLISTIDDALHFVQSKAPHSKNMNNSNTNDDDVKEAKRVSISLPKDFEGVKVELTEYYQNLLNELSQISEPKLLYKYFMICLSTPRPSGKLDKMRSVLKQISSLLDVEYTTDKVGNVCIKKSGSKGYEKAPGVTIQCHMDMVCTKTDDCKFDFDKDPIKAYIDGEWLKAKNTTLGADDGIGVAAGLALLEHPNLVHGPIELLITVDEETGLEGAIGLEKSPFLQNKILINVDSEEDDRICIGCAGSFKKEFVINMNKNIIKNHNNEYKVYKINICGLFGGHSGCEIHLGRGNAIKLLCRILNYCIMDKNIDLQLVEICGGNALNAIPCSSYCIVIVSTKLGNKFKECVQDYWSNYIMNEFKDIEKNMRLDLVDDEEINTNFSFKNTEICNVESSNILISLMMNLPHGVIRMSPTINDLVQTSISFSQIELKKNSNKAICGLLARSMSINEMLELNRKMDCLSMLFGKDIQIEINEAKGLMPGWDPINKSPALDHCKNAHLALFNKNADIYAVHAGLECGLIKNKYPEMDCISIGPLILDAHSTDEKLKINTINPFYNWLCETITRIAIQKS